MMKELNHINFDEWLLAYFEGTLSAEEKQQLMTFVNENPSLKEGFDLMEVPLVSATNIEVPSGLEKQFIRKKWYAKPSSKLLMITAGAAIVAAGILLLKNQNSEELVPATQLNNSQLQETLQDSSSILIINKNEATQNENTNRNQAQHQLKKQQVPNVIEESSTTKLAPEALVPQQNIPEIKTEDLKPQEVLSPVETKKVDKPSTTKPIKKDQQDILDPQLQ
ncbi:MAG: hypothetical protein NT150_14630 [Bacteroidetes bacterium]|nr:hypothetical protein [Bacteroidota bacterium]